MQPTRNHRGIRAFSQGTSSILAAAYLRLLAQATNSPPNGHLDRPEDSPDTDSEGLDSRPGIAMTCAGQDDNPLAGKELGP
jgi:hypothetical protein